MTDFNLRHLVREVLANSTLNDPHAIAAEAARRIKNGDLRSALEQCLAHLVREEIRNSRNGGLAALSTPDVRQTPPRLTLHRQSEVMTERVGGAPRTAVNLARQPARSAKVAAIREAGPKWLLDRLNTGADPREWKRIGDCTFTDLMFAVAQRREQAARTSAAAERLEALAELVRAHGVERVRDLPETVLAQAGGAAA